MGDVDGEVWLECRPDQVEVSVTWALEQDGSLAGWVEVRNTVAETLRLTGKPSVVPLSALDQTPLGVQGIITLELKLPNYVVLRPGARARAPIWWGAWPGPPVSDELLVSWNEHRQQVTVQGPSQPSRVDGPTNTSTSWFTLVP